PTTQIFMSSPRGPLQPKIGCCFKARNAPIDASLRLKSSSGRHFTQLSVGPVMSQASISSNPSAPVWTPVPLPEQVPVKEGRAKLPGTTLWYWDTGGTGPVVVLLHAASGSGAFWG